LNAVISSIVQPIKGYDGLPPLIPSNAELICGNELVDFTLVCEALFKIYSCFVQCNTSPRHFDLFQRKKLFDKPLMCAL
jgi:hypothetical protein